MNPKRILQILPLGCVRRIRQARSRRHMQADRNRGGTWSLRLKKNTLLPTVL